MIVRRVEPRDIPQMVALLNAIIAKGGTTAHQQPFDHEKMRQHYVEAQLGISTHVAVVDDEVAGFQSLEYPDPARGAMPANWAMIASFVAEGMGGRGIGKALFAATVAAAQGTGIVTIDATIRADNESGLGYYTAMGFRDYDRLDAVPLADGTKVDRIRKRFDL